ncbi:APC family permease [bacterium]|nr:APC family permease [bacterium]
MFRKIKRAVIGAPRDLADKATFHNISLIALLAWVGLGADGLSSSSYGPDEAYRALIAGDRTSLAIGLALATAITVTVISIAYGHIIEHFPFGGGGYVVSTQLLGPRAGLVSGAALLVDYVLTVSVSIASGADAILSVLPEHYYQYKLTITTVAILVLVILNMRGVKESVMVLAPIFFLFLVTHVILIVGGIGVHVADAPRVIRSVAGDLHHGWSLGGFAMMALFMRAYSMGAGTYTGIEAVSNGLPIMREPKVQTGKRTMIYMAVSLMFTAGGILICYLLFDVRPHGNDTLNAVLLNNFAGSWRPLNLPVGHAFVVVTLAAETALLLVAAQTGFIDGPRVMGNMALDSWLPRRFTLLSDRLTMQNGVLLMGAAAIATLYYTGGNITQLVTMYSINVFLTFSLSNLGMCLFWWKSRKRRPSWKTQMAVHGIALALCALILVVVVIEKFGQGGYITLAVTTLLVMLCISIRRHYRNVQADVRQLDEILTGVPLHDHYVEKNLESGQPTAAVMVGGYSGFGVHQMLSIQRLFPGHFKQYLFISVAVIDAATSKGIDEVEQARIRAEDALKKYVDLAHRLGFAADYRLDIGTDPVEKGLELCHDVHRQYPRALFFMGNLIFPSDTIFTRLLHNEMAYQLQRRLHFGGLNAIVLPVRAQPRKGAQRITPAQPSPKP